MSKKPHDLFKFWVELKRRKVVKASMVYLAAAFAILQAVDTIFPKLGLPDWTVTFVIILLIIVFILVVILTWVYDITPEGIRVTQTAEEGEQEREAVKTISTRAPGKQTAAVEEEDDLRAKVRALEDQLAGTKRLTLKSALGLLARKLALPFVVLVLLILLVVYKEEIAGIFGVGNAGREIARTHVKNAITYIDQNEFEAANREIDLALESDPGYSYAWSSLAAISIRQGDLNKAIAQTIKAIELDPANATAAYNLAYALEDKNDTNQAIEWYSKAIKADSSLIPAYSALGRLYNTMNKTINAVLVLNLAKRKYPQSDTIYLIYKNLGNAYLIEGLADTALKYLELSDRLKPGELETSLYLARAYEAAGQINKSIDQWQKYIGLETDSDKIGEAKRHMRELAIRQYQEIIK